MFKSILTAVATASIALAGFTTGAEARTRCHDINGYDLCTIDNGDYGTDALGVYHNGNRLLTMNVICTGNGGNRWHANYDTREFTKANLQSLASWWCANY